MAYYASKSSIRRGKERKASIKATGHYGGTTKAMRSGKGTPRTDNTAYARYGSAGQGLTDVGYATWITGRAKKGLGTVVENPMSYLAGMAQMGKPVTWTKPGYKGSLEEGFVKEQAPDVGGFAPEGILTGYGGIPTGGAEGLGNLFKGRGGRGRGIGWAFAGKPMGLPPGDEAGGGLKGLLTVGGLTYIVLKVLL